MGHEARKVRNKTRIISTIRTEKLLTVKSKYSRICLSSSHQEHIFYSHKNSILINSFIYIYIYTNLLSTSIHGYQEKRKETRQEQEIKISRITARGEKRKKISLEKIKNKQEKTNSVTPVENNQEICSQLVKRKIKPTVKHCNATITRMLNTSGANYKINLNRESEFAY